jgi:hypothetical protein
MDVLYENWFFIAVLLACVGMHLFMHGRHGHGHAHQHHAPGDADRSGAPTVDLPRETPLSNRRR